MYLELLMYNLLIFVKSKNFIVVAPLYQFSWFPLNQMGITSVTLPGIVPVFISPISVEKSCGAGMHGFQWSLELPSRVSFRVVLTGL